MTKNPARPPSGLRLCALADLPDPGAKGFRFREDTRLFAGFVVRKGRAVAGYVDSCPHAGWPLAAMDDRYLIKGGERILCAGHGALFDTFTGRCTSGPCFGESLTAWPVALDGDDIVTA